MRKLTIVIVLLMFLGCKKEQSLKERTKYEVLQTLYNYTTKSHTNILAFPPSTIPPKPGSSVDFDSLYKKNEEERQIVKDTIKIINSYIKKEGRLIVCIDKTQNPSIDLSKRKISCITKEFKSLINKFIKTKEIQTLDLTKIKDNKYSVITPYHDYYPKMSNKGFDKCDMVLTFSRIAINEEEDKAIAIMVTNFGRLNGFSALFFLKKENGTWRIKCREGLTIS